MPSHPFDMLVDSLDKRLLLWIPMGIQNEGGMIRYGISRIDHAHCYGYWLYLHSNHPQVSC